MVEGNTEDEKAGIRVTHEDMIDTDELESVYSSDEEAPRLSAKEKGKGKESTHIGEIRDNSNPVTLVEEAEYIENRAKMAQERSDFELALRLQREFDEQETTQSSPTVEVREEDDTPEKLRERADFESAMQLTRGCKDERIAHDEPSGV